MSEATLIETLRTSAEAKRILERDFDFIAVPPRSKSSLFRISNRRFDDYEIIGTDTKCGVFALCDARSSLSARPLLYASFEGQAGIIARSLESGLSTIIDLPYWQDCLKYSKNGELVEMRRVVPLAESDLVAKKPHIVTNRETARTIFGLSQVPDSVAELHSALVELSPLYAVYGGVYGEEWQFESLFGKLTVIANGDWRRRLNLQP